jgi:hypothetical protein
MYEFWYLFDSIDIHSPVERQFEKMFLIHKEADNYGLLYEVASGSTPLKVSVDSVLKSISLSPLKWENVLAIEPSSSVEFSILEIDTYVFEPSASINHIDSVFFYYLHGSARHFYYSLSPKLDSAKKKQLYKIEMVQNPVYSSQLNKTIPRRVLRYELDRIPILNPEEKLNYFKRFEVDMRKDDQID